MSSLQKWAHPSEAEVAEDGGEHGIIQDGPAPCQSSSEAGFGRH